MLERPSREAPGTLPLLDPLIDSTMGAPPLIRPLVGVLRRNTPVDMACLCGFWEVRLPAFGGMVIDRAEPSAGPSAACDVGDNRKLRIRDKRKLRTPCCRYCPRWLRQRVGNGAGFTAGRHGCS